MSVTQNAQNDFRYSITHWFQPIYQIKSNMILGHEALLRDASQLHVSPVDLFKRAERFGYRDTLDFLSIKCALDTFRSEADLLFLNIFPSTLLKKDFIIWWEKHVPQSCSVVLELLENEPVINWDEIKKVTEMLKDRGVRIAVDDMGGGYSFFQQWIELEPDYIKLDRYFAENLSMDNRKQRTVNSLIELLSDSTEIIMEGIENEEDLAAAEQLGIIYAQGYLLGRPSPAKKAISQEQRTF